MRRSISDRAKEAARARWRKRAPDRCGSCGELGHKRHYCPHDTSSASRRRERIKDPVEAPTTRTFDYQDAADLARRPWCRKCEGPLIVSITPFVSCLNGHTATVKSWWDLEVRRRG